MPLRRPIVFFDTGIYSHAEKLLDGITPEDWRFVNRFVQKHYRVVVSWTTLKELLCRLATCRDEYFVANLTALRRADRHARMKGGRFLEKPQMFAIEHTLGIGVRPLLDREGRPNIPHDTWAREVVDAVLKAVNREQLLKGVELRPKANIYGSFDLTDFAQFEEGPRAEFVQINEKMRTCEIDPPLPVTFAANLLVDCDLEPLSEHCHTLSLALDAVNCAVSWFHEISKNSSYSFERHKNNWDDLQQLFYLCDPSMTFVTLNTKDFMAWTKSSTQRARIMSWSQFVAHARASVGANTVALQ